MFQIKQYRTKISLVYFIIHGTTILIIHESTEKKQNKHLLHVSICELKINKPNKINLSNMVKRKLISLKQYVWLK